MALKFLLLLGLAIVVRAQLPGFGSCPEYVPVANFDIAKFMGTWYENERYFSLFEVGTRCARIEYTTAPNGKFLAANTITSRITGITRVVNGELKFASTNTNEGRLTIRYEQLPVAINSEYSVVATDYDNYAILWSCSSPVPYLLTTQNAWLMTREAEPSPAVMNEAIAQFEKLGINRRFISKVDQKSCSEAAAAAAAAEAAAAGVTPAEATAAPAAAPAEAPPAEAAPPAAVAVPSDEAPPAPAVRNQQVYLKPEINAVEVENKKPVVAALVKDEEIKVKEPEVPPTPEPEPASAAEPIVPEPAVIPAEPMKIDQVKTEKEDSVEPTKVKDEVKV